MDLAMELFPEEKPLGLFQIKGIFENDEICLCEEKENDGYQVFFLF